MEGEGGRVGSVISDDFGERLPASLVSLEKENSSLPSPSPLCLSETRGKHGS